MRRTTSVLSIAGLALAAVAVSGSSAAAQDASRSSRWEFLVSSGRLVPTGAQRGAVQAGNHTAAQLARSITPSLALTSTLGWARSRDVAVASTHLNVFMVDVGSELRAQRSTNTDGFSLSPFATAGIGARSYRARSVSASARHNAAAYLGAGGEIGIYRVRVRLEARDYVSGFRSFDGTGATVGRNDIVMMAGLRLVKP